MVVVICRSPTVSADCNSCHWPFLGPSGVPGVDVLGRDNLVL